MYERQFTQKSSASARSAGVRETDGLEERDSFRLSDPARPQAANVPEWSEISAIAGAGQSMMNHSQVSHSTAHQGHLGAKQQSSSQQQTRTRESLSNRSHASSSSSRHVSTGGQSQKAPSQALSKHHVGTDRQGGTHRVYDAFRDNPAALDGTKLSLVSATPAITTLSLSEQVDTGGTDTEHTSNSLNRLPANRNRHLMPPQLQKVQVLYVSNNALTSLRGLGEFRAGEYVCVYVCVCLALSFITFSAPYHITITLTMTCIHTYIHNFLFPNNVIIIITYISVRNASLSNNQIDQLEELSHLSLLPLLEKLSLQGNPVVNMPFYRTIVLSHCPSLILLDGVRVSAAERRGNQADKRGAGEWECMCVYECMSV